ncbi:hypothetical protein HN954_03900 [bacterium]|jgi:hypothetical protein|nr:hypothetical protein [bacterium]MBT6831719.1 hypothetical protein [bacterium]MBT6996542.1 hypothetical protein [bacterium]MBT7772868.1 hypothetical protein [bacterium]
MKLLKNPAQKNFEFNSKFVFENNSAEKQESLSPQEWAKENLKKDTQERLAALGYSVAVMSAAKEANTQVDAKIGSVMAALTNNATVDLKNLAEKYLVNKSLPDPEMRKLYRTEMFATLLEQIKENRTKIQLTDDQLSEFLLHGMAAVYSFPKYEQTVYKSLYSASRMMKYDKNHSGVNVTEWTNGGSLMRYEKKMSQSNVTATFENGMMTLSSGEKVQITGCEILTGGAMAEYDPILLNKFEMGNVVFDGGKTRVLARVSNGCHGNLVAIKLGKSPKPKPTPPDPEIIHENNECLSAVVNGVGNKEQRIKLVESTRAEAEKFLTADKNMFDKLYGEEKKNGKRKKRKSAFKNLDDIANNAGLIKGGVLGWVDALGKTIVGAKTPREKFLKKTGLDGKTFKDAQGNEIDAIEELKNREALCQKMTKRFEKTGHFAGEMETLTQDIALTVLSSALTGGLALVATNIKTPFFKDLLRVGDLNVIYSGLMAMEDRSIAALANSDNPYEKFMNWQTDAQFQMIEAQQNLGRGGVVGNETLVKNAERNKQTISMLDDAFERYEGATEDKAKQVKKASFDTFGDRKKRKTYRENKRILKDPYEPDLEKTKAAEKMLGVLVTELNDDLKKGFDRKSEKIQNWEIIRFEKLGEGISGFKTIPLGAEKTGRGAIIPFFAQQQEVNGKAVWKFYKSNENVSSQAPNLTNAEEVNFENLPKKHKKRFDEFLTRIAAVKNLYNLATNAQQHAETKNDLTQLTNEQQLTFDTKKGRMETAEENVYRNSVLGFLHSFENWKDFKNSELLQFFESETHDSLQKFFVEGRINSFGNENFTQMIESPAFGKSLENIQKFFKNATFELGDEMDLTYREHEEKLETLSSKELMNNLTDCSESHAKIYYPDLVGQRNRYVPLIVPVDSIRALFKTPAAPPVFKTPAGAHNILSA